MILEASWSPSLWLALKVICLAAAINPLLMLKGFSRSITFSAAYRSLFLLHYLDIFDVSGVFTCLIYRTKSYEPCS
jgi:hypothetical protein